jgi:hypothetical protein
MIEEIFIFVLSVLTIASSSIGIQAIGNNQEYQRNKNFLVVMLVASIMALLFSAFLLYKSFKPA